MKGSIVIDGDWPSLFAILRFRKIPGTVSIEVKDCAIKFLEHVQIRVNLNFSRRGDLSLQLRAPSNTTSPMTRKRFVDNLTGFRNLTDWIITSLFHWEEDPTGRWELKIDDFDKRYPSSGDLSWLSLKVLSYCVFVGGFVFVLIFTQSSEMLDRTSCVSITSNALFNLLPGNLGRPKLRTFKLSTSFLIVMGRWNAEHFFCSFICLFYSMLLFHTRDRKFWAFSYGIRWSKSFTCSDSAIQLLLGYRFRNSWIVNFLRSLGMFPCLFHRSTSRLVLDIVWHFFRPTYIRTKERNRFDTCYIYWETQIFNETNENSHPNWTTLVNSQNKQRYVNLNFAALKT